MQVIRYRLIDRIKVVVDVEPEDHNVARCLYGKWLHWVVDNDINVSPGSCGPTGFVCYVHTDYREDVAAWLRDNIGDA